MRRSLAAAVVLCTALAGGPAAHAADDTFSSKAIRKHVTIEGVMAHERALQLIADANGGTRVSGSPGYDASADYVARRLRKAGLRVTRQAFDFRFFEELSAPELARTAPTERTYAVGTDFATMDFSGSAPAGVSAEVQAVDVVLPPSPTPNAGTSGCEAADFAGFVAGRIALLQRGTCDFGVKARNAQAAGAAGVIIFNEGTPGVEDRSTLLLGTLGEESFADIPVLGTTFAVGSELAGLGTPTVRIRTETFQEVRSTENVFGDTRGDADRTMVVGAHLDSVGEGPGINDNGSGTSATLEVAESLDRGPKPRNRVRFAFWGAEEAGLIGSTHYVGGLSEEDLARHKANLNFDMLASPNFVRFVYDGDGSAGLSDPGPPGSGLIEKVFLDYFAAQGLPTEPTAFDGRSDYGPFIAAGVPAGGLFTGAEDIKTPEQAAVYGGTAGAAYDPCYHEACDTLGNVNETVLDQFSDGVAHAVVQLARTKADIAAEGAVLKRQGAAGHGTRRGPHHIR